MAKPNIKRRAAALPPHIAVSLGLTVAASPTHNGGSASPRRSLGRVQDRTRKAKGFPLCTAAKPHEPTDPIVISTDPFAIPADSIVSAKIPIVTATIPTVTAEITTVIMIISVVTAIISVVIIAIPIAGVAIPIEIQAVPHISPYFWLKYCPFSIDDLSFLAHWSRSLPRSRFCTYP
jgi:hypothetical protein